MRGWVEGSSGNASQVKSEHRLTLWILEPIKL